MKSDQAKILAIHIVGIVGVTACWLCAFFVPQIKANPALGHALVAAGTGIYAALGFKPLPPVVAQIIRSMDPVQVAALSTRPPADIITKN
jgi:hypothetical protein